MFTKQVSGNFSGVGCDDYDGIKAAFAMSRPAQPVAPEPLSAYDQAELNAWHDQLDQSSGDDHAFDIWLADEFRRLWAEVRRLEIQLEAATAF